MFSANKFIGVVVCLCALTACAPATAATVSPPEIRVERVIDGDTFVSDEGLKVRVLGIDSCESGTAGGAAATAQARQLLEGETVTLTAEPGRDLDRYGRALRYVELADGRDFGTRMVSARHTHPYQGRSDASRAYMAMLAAQDINGRVC